MGTVKCLRNDNNILYSCNTFQERRSKHFTTCSASQTPVGYVGGEKFEIIKMEMKVLSGNIQGCKSACAWVHLGYLCIAHPEFPLCIDGAWEKHLQPLTATFPPPCKSSPLATSRENVYLLTKGRKAGAMSNSGPAHSISCEMCLCSLCMAPCTRENRTLLWHPFQRWPAPCGRMRASIPWAIADLGKLDRTQDLRQSS